MNGVSHWLQTKATRAFWVFFALHVLVWTFIPTFIQHNAPLDVVEGYAWGREWLLGTHKHPPLQAWLLEIIGTVLGNSGFNHFGLSALFGALALWAVYRTGLLFASKTMALLGTFACTGILYFNYLTPEFNPNVLQLVLWAWAGHYFAKACIKENTRSWIKLGLIGGIGLYAKFSTALLLAGFVLFFLLNQQTRTQLKKAGPYLAALLCIALFIPEAIWLEKHDFMPFAYAKSRAEGAANIIERFIFPTKFALSQIAAMILSLILCAGFLFKNFEIKKADFQSRLLLWLAFGPLFLCLLLSFLAGQKMKDMWGMPLLSFIPLFLLSYAKDFTQEKKLGGFIKGAVFFFVLTPCLFVLNYHNAVDLGFKHLRGHFDGPALSRAAHNAWKKTTDAPLSYVIGDTWLAGNIALYAPDFKNRPHVFIDSRAEINPTISVSDIKAKGAIVIWKSGFEAPALPDGLILPKEITKIEIPWVIDADHDSDIPSFNLAFIKPE